MPEKTIHTKKTGLIWALAALLVILAIVLFITTPWFLSVPAAAILTITIILLATETTTLTIKEKTSDFSERQFQFLIETIPDGVIIYNPEFEITSMNEHAEHIIGLKTNEVTGKSITPQSAKDPRFRTLTYILYPTLAPIVTQVSEDKWPQVVDITIEKPHLILRTILNQVYDKNGKPTRFIKIVNDRTRESEIIESKKEFLNTAAHQLRTPINAISWALENIASQTKEDETKEIALEGKQTAERSLKTINDLLDAARIESGKFGYKFKEINIVATLQKIVDRAQEVAEESGIVVSFDAPAKQVITITADQDRLAMALSNIIDNAIKYNTQNGRVILRVEELQGQEFVKILVQDTGIGIPPEEQRKVFTKFFRADNATQLAPDGTGLGLYIVRNVIKNHGGDIGVESIPDRGTTVWFTLPTNPNLVAKKERAYDVEQ
jgi:signal transduction histidine kinase